MVLIAMQLFLLLKIEMIVKYLILVYCAIERIKNNEKKI